MTEHRVHDHVSGTLSKLDEEVIRHVPPGGNWRDLPADFPSARVRQIRESAARGEGSRSTYYGRLAWNRPAYTISTYITRPGNGAFIHPAMPRLLTVREAARLQSFPDEVRFHGTLRQRSMQIGNAVPPMLAYQIGRAIPGGSVVDLFAGAGGLGLGLSWAGHEIIASVDNNHDASRTCAAAHDASVQVLERDLSDADQAEDVINRVRKRIRGGRLNLLAGGPPCQGFSTAGPCRVDDPRNELILSFLRFVQLLEPAHVLLENVVALRSRGRAFLDELTERLSHMGYAVAIRVLHAEAYGVPQLRRRLVLQACARGEEPVWPQPTHAMHPPFFRADQPGIHVDEPGPRTVGDAMADLAIPLAPSLDTSVVALPAESAYTRWARGEVSIENLLGLFAPAISAQS